MGLGSVLSLWEQTATIELDDGALLVLGHHEGNWRVARFGGDKRPDPFSSGETSKRLCVGYWDGSPDECPDVELGEDAIFCTVQTELLGAVDYCSFDRGDTWTEG